MSIQIQYTDAGDLLIRCGDDAVVWSLATLRAAAAAGDGSPGAAPSPTPSITPAPATADPQPAPSIAPPPKPPKIGYPPPLPGAMTFIVSRRSGTGLQAYPWFAADWPMPAGLQLPLEQLQQASPELLLNDLRHRLASHRGGLAGRCLTVIVQPSHLHMPLDVGRLQWLADDPTLGLEGVRLQFDVPRTGEPR